MIERMYDKIVIQHNKLYKKKSHPGQYQIRHMDFEKTAGGKNDTIEVLLSIPGDLENLTNTSYTEYK